MTLKTELTIPKWDNLKEDEKDLHAEILSAFFQLDIDLCAEEIQTEANCTGRLLYQIFAAYNSGHPDDMFRMLPLTRMDSLNLRTDSKSGAIPTSTFLAKLQSVILYFYVNRGTKWKELTEDETMETYVGSATKESLIDCLGALYELHKESSHGDKYRIKKPSSTIELKPFQVSKNDWVNWELDTVARFQAGGVVKIIQDSAFAKAHPELNSCVAGILKSAFSSEEACMSMSFLEPDEESANDGYGMWQRLLEYYTNNDLLQAQINLAQQRLETLTFTTDGERFIIMYVGLYNTIQRLHERAKLRELPINPSVHPVQSFLTKFHSKEVYGSYALQIQGRDPPLKTVWEAACALRQLLSTNKGYLETINPTHKKESGKKPGAPKDAGKQMEQAPSAKTAKMDTSKKGIYSYANSLKQSGNHALSKAIIAAMKESHSPDETDKKSDKKPANRRRSAATDSDPDEDASPEDIDFDKANGKRKSQASTLKKKKRKRQKKGNKE